MGQLLYTATSQACLLNPEYIEDFEKPLDVFATGNNQIAKFVNFACGWSQR